MLRKLFFQFETTATSRVWWFELTRCATCASSPAETSGWSTTAHVGCDVCAGMLCGVFAPVQISTAAFCVVQLKLTRCASRASSSKEALCLRNNSTCRGKKQLEYGSTCRTYFIQFEPTATCREEMFEQERCASCFSICNDRHTFEESFEQVRWSKI